MQPQLCPCTHLSRSVGVIADIKDNSLSSFVQRHAGLKETTRSGHGWDSQDLFELWGTLGARSLAWGSSYRAPLPKPEAGQKKKKDRKRVRDEDREKKRKECFS
ncbi:hypothetical protein EYF80_024745 [Liparis tanakae]|uniref:Uncharacterized protein n=1 Tax=Liparis tanakae TaxID=230148 RepID=A0A4Z2HH04_9TELE|nr:hypothetical protein EYF80_024745 [Liparis tanakae]